MGSIILVLAVLSIYHGFKQLTKKALLEKLMRIASCYPLSRCQSRYHVGLLYGHLHSQTEAAGFTPMERHRIAARAMDHALLYPASKKLSSWIEHDCKETLQGWYAGKQFGEKRKSGWNKDDREFLELFD